MNRISFSILCFLSGLLLGSAADLKELHGIITDSKTGEPVAGAVVQALDSRGRAVAFASSSTRGEFTLKMNTAADSLSFRCMGYETLKLPAAGDLSSGVKMNPKATVLNDVIIRAPDIYAKGDTLVFNVDRYATAKDNAIIDVIKRLPGIKVEKDGTITYQGKPINKFYIDGNDFVGGQYGLATDNISHKDVKSVEVMENHQPVKALEGIEFPEEAGINLKLKEDARSRWVGVAQAAAGVQPLLYDGSLFMMRIASRMQNMFTLKADNTGWNPANQIKEHDFSDMFSSDYTSMLWPEYISADVVKAPLSEKRTRDNMSWIANAITAWRSGDTSMRLKLNYMADRLDYTTGVITDYLDSQIPDFVQRSDMRSRHHDLSAQLNTETNRRGYFLKDKLTIGATFDDAASAITGSSDLRQTVDRKTLSAVNDLKLIKRNDKRVFTVTSRNAFTRRPDCLLVTDATEAIQSIGTTDVRSTTETQFGRLRRFWKYYVTTGVDLDYHRMNTSLTGLPEFDNAGVYNAFLSDVYATPQVDYDRARWRISLRVPVRWLHYSIRGQHDYINLSPRLHINRRLSARSEVSGAVSYRLGSPQAYLNIGAPVLSDYRNLFIGCTPDRYSGSVSASVSYRFRNPLSAFFANASASYSHSRSSAMSNQIFTGDIIVTTYSERLSDSHSWTFNGSMSKGMGHGKMVAGCDLTASLSEASAMRNGQVIPYRQSTAGIKPYFKGSLQRWLSINYEAEFSISRLEINREANDYRSLDQNLFVTVMPTDHLDFTAGAEHYLTRFPEGNCAAMLLLDASATWRLNGRIRLSLTAGNLLDKRRYQYVNYGTLSRSEYSFALRPRTILASIQYRF